MGSFAKLFLLCLVAALIGLAYVVRLLFVYIGSDILLTGWRLLRQGSLRISALSFRPNLAVQGLAVIQRKAAGKEQLFHAKMCSIQSPLKDLLTGQRVELAISDATAYLHQNSQGEFNWINLLQTVDAVTTVPAEPVTSVEPLAQAKTEPGTLKKSKSVKQAAATAYQKVALTADVSAYILHATVRDSALELPEHAALILGDKLHVKAVLGMPNVALHAEATEGYDSAWCSDAAAWPAATPLTGSVLYPLLLEVQSPNCKLGVQGWRTSTGLLLHQPISASLAFTPAFVKYALRQLSPLLGGAGGLQGGSSMHVSIEAVKQHLPAERYTVRVQPMRLIMGSSAFLSGIMGLLKLRQLQSTNFEAWTSPIETDIHAGSQVISKRVDILLGSSLGKCKGVHVMMWGQIDLISNTVDMTLGIPTPALAAAGVRQLPDDYVLPVPVKGTTQSPVVNWPKAAAQLTELTIRRRVQKDIPWLANVVGAFGGPKLDMTDYPTAPEAVGNLPWEAQDVDEAEVVMGAEI